MSHPSRFQYYFFSLVLIGILCSFSGHMLIGSIIVVISCLIPYKKNLQFDEINPYILISIIPVTWILSLSNNGLSPIEILTIMPVIASSSAIFPRRDGFYPVLFRNSLILFSISQITLYGLFMGWTPELLIIGIAVSGFWQEMSEPPHPIYHAGLLAGLFSGVASLKIPLRGGISNSTDIQIIGAHEQWIAILSSTILGATLFYLLLSLVSFHGDEEE